MMEDKHIRIFLSDATLLFVSDASLMLYCQFLQMIEYRPQMITHCNCGQGEFDDKYQLTEKIDQERIKWNGSYKTLEYRKYFFSYGSSTYLKGFVLVLGFASFE